MLKEGCYEAIKRTFLCKICPAFHALMLTAVLYSKDNCSLQLSTSSGNGRGNVTFLSTPSQCWQQTVSKVSWKLCLKEAQKQLSPSPTSSRHCLTEEIPRVHRHYSLWAPALPCSTDFCWAMTVTAPIWSVFHNFGFAVPPSLSMFLVTAVSFCLLLSLVCNFALWNFY